MVAITTTAISGGQFVLKPPDVRKARARAAACSGRSCRKMSGQKKLFQVPWNWRMATAARAGPASGSITRQKVVKKPGAVDPGGLLQLARDRQEVLAQQEDRSSPRSRGPAMTPTYWPSPRVRPSVVEQHVDRHEAELVGDHQRGQHDRNSSSRPGNRRRAKA